jgi:SHS2 domain-containing protein
MKIFEQLPHTADIKIRVFGSTKKELFKHALIGMFQVIGPHAKGCTKEGDFLVCPTLPKKHEIEINSPDNESLLVDFLSDALWFSDVYNEAYLDVDIHELSDTHIKATIYGVEVTGFDVVEIKAVTYHDLYVKQVNDMWQAEIVFDI